jgi:micrococcal nuclease
MTITPPVDSDVLYEYRAYINDKYQGVYDGDTIYVDVDFGMFARRVRQPIRLLDVDAPEVRGEERLDGVRVRTWLRDQLTPGEEVRIRTYKDKQSFTRWLAHVWRKDSEGNWVHVNQEINDWMRENNLIPGEDDAE